MRFELPSSQTLEFSGSRTVPVKSCGAEKRSFTVTLGVPADFGPNFLPRSSLKASTYLAWMFTGPFEFTLAGNKKAPTRNLVLRWIKEAWQEIPEEMAKKGFKSCGISNGRNGRRRNLLRGLTGTR